MAECLSGLASLHSRPACTSQLGADAHSALLGDVRHVLWMTVAGEGGAEELAWCKFHEGVEGSGLFNLLKVTYQVAESRPDSRVI